MALPRFLYSENDSVHEPFLPRPECDDPLLVSPKAKSDFTGALSKSKKEIANNPALPAHFVGNLQDDASESEEEGEKDVLEHQRRLGARREWEFGAVAMELSVPGAGDGGSDSDESGILEHMGERRPSMRKRNEAGNGVVGNSVNVGINDGDNSESLPPSSRATSNTSKRSSAATQSGTHCDTRSLVRE